MKISKILLETILPITIGALLIVGYRFISDRFFPEAGLENYVGFRLGILEYLKMALTIVIPLSLYQIMVGDFILKRKGNSFGLNFLNSLVFALIVIGILIIINLFIHKLEWDFYPLIFLALFLLGVLFTVLINVCRRIFVKKLVD